MDATIPSMRVRLASPDDADTLASLGARLFADTFGAQNRAADMAAYLAVAFGAHQQRHELASPTWRTWLAEDASLQPAGYAQVRRGTRSNQVQAERPAEIARLYVAPEWQGHGLARRLMDACLTTAREWRADVVWLGVWERNPRAIAFYEKCGFRKVGTQSFMLGADLQTDHVMARALEPSAGDSPRQ
jgi:ribosomal protein S18 acetylase RimI-like enzyme